MADPIRYCKCDEDCPIHGTGDVYTKEQAVLVSRLADLLAARDAEWRAAVERVREQHPGVLAPAEYSVPEARVWARGAESALKSLLAAMEAK